MWDESAFEAFVGALGLTHFKPAEFLVKTERDGNFPPDDTLWPNIAATALVLDALRGHFGRPVHLFSVYRAPVYNAGVGGAARSQHVAFAAADFAVIGISPGEVAEVLRDWNGKKWLPCPFDATKRQPFKTEDGSATPMQALNTRDGQNEPQFQFAGGVGQYDNFTHVDTRGFAATW